MINPNGRTEISSAQRAMRSLPLRNNQRHIVSQKNVSQKKSPAEAGDLSDGWFNAAAGSG
jgi:hypothetical protein